MVQRRIERKLAAVFVAHVVGYSRDLARGCLRAGDQQIDVRPKSFDVLHFLLENPGRLISKDELVKTVWPNTFVTDGALTHCMSEVRGALGDCAWCADRDATLQQLAAELEMALALDDNDSDVHRILAALNLFRRPCGHWRRNSTSA